MTTSDDRFPYNAHDAEDVAFVGEAILDKNTNTGDPELYTMVGLNRNEWKIVGIHAAPANASNKRGYVTILAVDRSKLDDAQNRPGGLAGMREVEVVQFDTSLTFEDIMSAMKSTSVFYKAKSLKDSDFYVTEKRELP